MADEKLRKLEKRLQENINDAEFMIESSKTFSIQRRLDFETYWHGALDIAEPALKLVQEIINAVDQEKI